MEMGKRCHAWNGQNQRERRMNKFREITYLDWRNSPVPSRLLNFL
jgi:hypothetical protein